jgi:GAF domain-containing protein
MASEDARRMAGLASRLYARSGETDTVRAVLVATVELIADAEHVSVTALRRGRLETWGSSSQLVDRVDRLQDELGEGPCVETATETAWSRSGDLGNDPRWPSWGPRAERAGLRSLLSVELRTHDGRLGALNIYAGRVGRLGSSEELERATLYASHAAQALACARQVAGLETALESRHTIGLAQGMLMERHGLTATQSFALLQRLSSVNNRKVRDLAADLVETRRLDGRPGTPGSR